MDEKENRGGPIPARRAFQGLSVASYIEIKMKDHGKKKENARKGSANQKAGER